MKSWSLPFLRGSLLCLMLFERGSSVPDVSAEAGMYTVQDFNLSPQASDHKPQSCCPSPSATLSLGPAGDR